MEFILLPTNTDGVVAKFEESAVAALDPIEPFSKIVDDIMRVEAILFNSQGRRGGGSWAPLKADTIRRKGNSRILEDSGALRASLTEPGAEYQILEMNRTGFAFGTDRPFAAVQNYGSPSRNIPARPIMKFMNTDLTRWNRWLAEHLMAPFNK